MVLEALPGSWRSRSGFSWLGLELGNVTLRAELGALGMGLGARGVRRFRRLLSFIVCFVPGSTSACALHDLCLSQPW